MISSNDIARVLHKLPLRTLQAKFLAINVPIVVLIILVLFALFELTAYQNGIERLENKPSSCINRWPQRA